MSWSTLFNSALSVLEVNFTGATRSRDLAAATASAVSLARRYGAKLFLIDTADVELKASFIDVFDLAHTQFDTVHANRQAYHALVLPKSARASQAVQFFRTACVNRGWRFAVFPDRDSALVWLKARHS